MQAGDIGEFVQNPSLLLPGNVKISPPYCFNIFQYAASGHFALLLGNTIYEATIPLSVTFIMSQFA
jgi:hypothetical protein